MSLSLEQIHNNCQCFNNYNFTNMTPDADGSVKGFSNINLGSKAIKSVGDWWSGYKDYEALQNVVILTLISIKEVFNTRGGICPYFFYMDVIAKSGIPTPVTYDVIAKRILNSNTLKNFERVRTKAQEVLDLYEAHHFGYDIPDASNDFIKELKVNLIEVLGKELSSHYEELAKNPDYQVNGFFHVVPPVDPRNYILMDKYIQKKWNDVLQNHLR